MNPIDPSRIPSTSTNAERTGASIASAAPRRGVAHAWAGKTLRAFGVTLLVAWFLFAGLVLALRYAVLPHIGEYRDQIENAASQALGERVRIGAVAASWHGLRPTLALTDLRIEDRNGKAALQIPSVRATLSWDSLVVLKIRLAELEIDGLDVAARRDAAGNIFVAGLQVLLGASSDNKIGEWIFAQNEIRIHNARVTWSDASRSSAGDTLDPTATRPELALEHVEMVLRRTAWRHRFALRATPAAALAAPLDLRAVIDRPLFSTRLADATTWRGEVYADLATQDADAWRAWVDLPPALLHGGGALRAWLRFTDADGSAPLLQLPGKRPSNTKTAATNAVTRIAEVTADLALHDVTTRVIEGGAEWVLATVAGRVVASQAEGIQTLAFRHLAVRGTDGLDLAPTDLTARRTLAKEGKDETGEATVNLIDLDTFARVATHLPLPKPLADALASYRPHGVLDSVAVKWSGALTVPQSWRFDSNFKGLAIAAQAPTAEAIRIASIEFIGPNGLLRRPRPAFGKPGFENLAGHVSATQASGTLTLKGENASLTMPGVFEEPTLRFAHLDASADWKAADGNIEVNVTRLALDNPDLAGMATATYRHGPQSGSVGPGWLLLDARLTRADAARVPRYLPTTIGERARVYLRKALVSGTVSEATFRIRGPIEQLNFRSQPDAVAVPRTTPLQAGATLIPPIATIAAPKAGAGTKAEGNEFHIAIKVHGATYQYGPPPSPEAVAAGTTSTPPGETPIGWPAFEDVEADIVFDHARMLVAARSARVFGVKLTDIKADLPALADPEHVLRVTGSGSGPLADIVRFVNASPIARWTRHFTETTRASGNAGFDLALDLPLTHMREAKVDGALRLTNNDVAFNAALPAITRVNGKVGFSESGVTIAGLTGQTLGGPLKVDATTRSDGAIEITGDGTLDAKTLRAKEVEASAAAVQPAIATPTLLQRVAQRLDGSARYTVTLNLHSRRAEGASVAAASGANAKPAVVIESNLAGLAIDLPAPLAKASAESWPLRIEVSRRTSPAGAVAVVDGEDIRASLAGKINVAIERRRNAQGELAVTRAAYGVNEPAVFAEGASYANVSLPALDLDAWQSAVKQIAGEIAAAQPVIDPSARPAVANAAASLVPNSFVLRTKDFKVAGRSFANVVLAASHGSEGWKANVDSDQVSGWATWSEVGATRSASGTSLAAAQNRLTARLTRLSIPQSESMPRHLDTLLDASKQKDIPAFDVIVDNFELRGKKLGRLEVQASNSSADGRREWKLEKLGLTMPEATFSATGSWGRAGNAQRTRLSFSVNASNVGQLMDRFGLRNTIKDGTAQLEGDVAWHGSPIAIDFESMDGKMHLEADKGQFLKADPGIAKLLGVLSLQSLPRRLTLDFRDLFADGFAFDSIRADANIAKGIASTDDFKMRGVAATVLLSGSADLEHETQDLHALVLPEINAGAAALGAAALNPALGLAAFVAQYLLKDSISRALSFEYNVTGPWSKPNVSKIDRNGNATPVAPRGTAAAAGVEPTRAGTVTE